MELDAVHERVVVDRAGVRSASAQRLPICFAARRGLETSLETLTRRLICPACGSRHITLAATPLIAPLLYRVSPADPVSILGAAVFLSVVAVLASLIPALRATRIDPIIALRQE